MKKEDIIRRHFHGFSDEQWNELKDRFPYSEIPFIIDDAIKNLDVDGDVESALLEAVWISRWSKSGDSLSAVLTTEEAFQIVKDIHIELAKIGYEIKKK